METPLQIFIGYDSREVAAFHTLASSIMRHASKPVAIVPLIQSQLRAMGVYVRETGPTESTEFSLTRFLVPYLSGYQGISIFMDCDMLCRGDIWDLPSYLDSYSAVAVCQHEYTPKTSIKMDGKVQTVYPRKNWSSLMVFDNGNYDCKQLTLSMVNSRSASYLQQLQWTDKIGALPLTWNWLVGEYEPDPEAKMLHYTLGGPWFDPWYKEAMKLNGC